MPNKTPAIKYLVLVALTILLGGAVYTAGKAPKVVEALLLQAIDDIHDKYGVKINLESISVEGFLNIRADNLRIEKKDIHLLVQARWVKAQLSLWQFLLNNTPISKLEIDNPEIMVKINADLLEPTRKSNFSDFKFDFSLSELIIHNARANIIFNNKTIQILKLETRAKISSKSAHFDLLSIDMPEGSLLADGEIYFENPKYLGLGTDIRLWLNSKIQNFPEIQKLEKPIKGDLRLQARVNYPTRKAGWNAQGKIIIENILIDKFKIDKLNSQFLANQKEAELINAKIDFAHTEIKATASLEFNKFFNFKAEIQTEDASLFHLLSDIGVQESWVDLKLETTGSITGQILPKFSLKGHAKGQVNNLVVQEPKHDIIIQTQFPIDFDMGLEVDKEAFYFKNANFRDSESEFTANCTLFFKGDGMDLDAQIKKLDFKSIKNKISEGEYFGTGEANLKITGPYQDILITAPAEIKNFRFDHFNLGHVKGSFKFHDNIIFVSDIRAKQDSLIYSGDLEVGLKKPTRLKLKANLYEGLFEDLRTYILPELDKLELNGPVNGRILLDGPVEKGFLNALTGEIELTLSENGKFFNSPLSSGYLLASISKNEAKIQSLKLDLEAAKINLTGHYNKLTNSGSGELNLQESWLSNGDFKLSLKDNKLFAYGLFEPSKTRTSVTIEMNKTLDFEAKLKMPFGPLQLWAKEAAWLEYYQVKAGLSLESTGRLTQFEDTKISLNLFPAIFYLGNLKLVASKRIRAEYKTKKLSFDPIMFRTIYGDFIEIGGSLDNNAVNLDFNSYGDLWILTHLDERVEGAYGDFKLKLLIKGPWDNLKYTGLGEVAPESYLSLRDYPPGLNSLSAKIDFKGDFADLKLKAKAKTGDINLAGRVDFSHSKFDDLQVNLFQMPVFYSSFLTGIASGFLKLDGPFAGPLLSGQIRFSKLLVTKELNPKEFQIQRSRAQKQALKFDIALSTENPIRVESKTFNGDLNGSLTLVGSSNTPGLIGELSVLSGEAYFRNNYYHILRARASFDSPVRIMPKIDLEANSQILDYDITVRAQGELSRPKLIFSSIPALPQSDLFSLISFGFTQKDNRDSLGVGRSLGLEALSAYSGIGERILSALPGDKIDELRLGTLYNPNGGVTSSVVLGMQVFKGMRLRFQSALVQNKLGNREKRVELEKYIDKRWRWRLVWNSAGDINYGDAGGDMWVRWDF